ncbi:hypothetical protein [uncultured Algimonas sp.]|uniref:hypothetical protein n=1 Tax=uncultured Algimonas sp. TaxID=1547920 RepID=UPI00261DD194|nr:hypothetical protein [uncultured Algimonas sp.]
MAEIPVEKKENSLWWLWLLGALLLAALLFWWFAGNDDDVDTVDTGTVDRVVVDSAVDMDDLRVTNVSGDMAFYAEDMSGTEYYIVFDEVRTPGTNQEGMLDINRGDMIDIEGTVRARDYDLPATVNATIPAGMDTFIFATDIDKE